MFHKWTSEKSTALPIVVTVVKAKKNALYISQTKGSNFSSVTLILSGRLQNTESFFRNSCPSFMLILCCRKWLVNKSVEKENNLSTKRCFVKHSHTHGERSYSLQVSVFVTLIDNIWHCPVVFKLFFLLSNEVMRWKEIQSD